MLAERYLQPGVAGQHGRLVVDGLDGDRHGDGEAAPLDLVGGGGQREVVLGGLAAVMQVEDVSQLHLEGNKQGDILDNHVLKMFCVTYLYIFIFGSYFHNFLVFILLYCIYI